MIMDLKKIRCEFNKAHFNCDGISDDAFREIIEKTMVGRVFVLKIALRDFGDALVASIKSTLGRG